MSLHWDMYPSRFRPSGSTNTHRARNPASTSIEEEEEESVRTTPFTKTGRGEIVDDSSSIRSMAAEEDNSYLTPEKNEYHGFVASGHDIYSPSVYDRPQTATTAGEEYESSDGQRSFLAQYEDHPDDQTEEIGTSFDEDLETLQYFGGTTTQGGSAPTPPDPEYTNTETLASQLSASNTALHHLVGSSMLRIGHQIEQNSSYSMDQIMKGIDGLNDATSMIDAQIRSQCDSIGELRLTLRDIKSHLNTLHTHYRGLETRLRATVCEENAQLRKDLFNCISAYLQVKPAFVPEPAPIKRQKADEVFLQNRKVSFQDEVKSAAPSHESSKEISKESSKGNSKESAKENPKESSKEDPQENSTKESSIASRQASADVSRHGPAPEKERHFKGKKSRKALKETASNRDASNESTQKESKESTRWEGPRRALRQMRSKTSMNNLNKRAQNKITPSAEEGIPPVPSIQQLPPATPAPTGPLPPVPTIPVQAPRSGSNSSADTVVPSKPSAGPVSAANPQQQRSTSGPASTERSATHKPSLGALAPDGQLMPPRSIPASSSTASLVPNKSSAGPAIAAGPRAMPTSSSKNTMGPCRPSPRAAIPAGPVQSGRSISEPSSTETMVPNKPSLGSPLAAGAPQGQRSIPVPSSANTIVPQRSSPATPQRAGLSQIPKPSSRTIGENAQANHSRTPEEYEAKHQGPETPTGPVHTPRTPAKRDRRGGIFTLSRKKEGENVKPAYSHQRPFTPNVAPPSGRPFTRDVGPSSGRPLAPRDAGNAPPPHPTMGSPFRGPPAVRPSTSRGTGVVPPPIGPPPSRPPPRPPVESAVPDRPPMFLDPRVGALPLPVPRQQYGHNVQTPTRGTPTRGARSGGSPVERSRWS